MKLRKPSLRQRISRSLGLVGKLGDGFVFAGIVMTIASAIGNPANAPILYLLGGLVISGAAVGAQTVIETFARESSHV